LKLSKTESESVQGWAPAPVLEAAATFRIEATASKLKLSKTELKSAQRWAPAREAAAPCVEKGCCFEVE